MHPLVRRLFRFCFALVATTSLLGCGDLFGPGGDRSALEANRQKWAERGYTNYTFTVSMLCFCAVNGPITVVVTGDSVVQATLQSNSQAVDPRWMPTVNKLFDFIERGIADHAAVLRVTYDPSFGYPREIVYDGSFGVADDEITYTVSDVTAR